jgi:hypothetical protein
MLFQGFTGGGGGGGSVKIQDEGVDVVSAASTLNFVGAQVQATGSGGLVTIQVPPSTDPSHFNSLDGNTSPIPSDTPVVDRKLSDSLGTFDFGDWVAGDTIPTTNTTPITYSTGSAFLIADNTSTTFTVEVLGDDDTTVLATHQITLTGNTDVTSDNIQIQITDFNTQGTAYKCVASVSIDIATVLGNSGRFSVVMTHDDDGTPYTFEQRNIFYDDNDTAISMSDPTWSENAPVLFTSSGVSFYGSGFIFNVSLPNIDNTNVDTYKISMFTIQNSLAGLPTLTLGPSDLTGWTNAYNNTGASYSKADWTINVNNVFLKDANVVQARWNDWVANTLQDSSSKNLLVASYVNNATRNFEDFRNETRRFESDLSTSWDSSIALDTIDSGTGLQVLGSKLIYPQEDFTIYDNPTTATQPDYSTETGSKVYYTEFNHPLTSHSNGIFMFSATGLAEANITDESFNIEVSLDGTDWFDVTEPYPGGSIGNGDGCRIDEGIYHLDSTTKRLRFTLGTGKFTGSDSGDLSNGGYGLWVRIIYDDSVNGKAIEIDSIEITDWV